MLRNLFGNLPVVTKNLFLLNILVFVVLITGGSDAMLPFRLNHVLGLYYIFSPDFQPFQIVTHLFCHADIFHLLFNMLALIMFGAVLERVWGPKRFLFFYLVTGLGAVLLHQFTMGLDLYNSIGEIKARDLIVEADSIRSFTYTQAQLEDIYRAYFVPTVGASGAIYGLLAALALLFPNTELMIMFIPVPVKAKYLVPVLMLVELTLGVRGFESDNIAHFAHLGGALFGFILIQVWKRDRNKFY